MSISWDYRSTEQWASLLGLSCLPLHAREESRHAVLLDGRSSFLLCFDTDGELAQSQLPLSWAWSANLPHTIVLDENQPRLTLRRWDNPDYVLHRDVPATQQLEDLISDFDTDKHSGAPSVIEHLLQLFRQLRESLSEYRVPPVTVVKVFNSLIDVAQSIQGDTPDIPDIPRTLEDVLVRTLHDSSLLPRRAAQLPSTDFINLLIEPAPITGYRLSPSLLLRHAAGVLYQEAENDLTSAAYIQGRLFNDPAFVADTRAIRETHSETHYTPPALARLLAEVAVRAVLANHNSPNSLSILDPACGSGVFLLEALRALERSGFDGELLVTGYDISESAVEMAKHCLHRHLENSSHKFRHKLNIANTDAMERNWQADVIMTNPPFKSWSEMTDTERIGVKATLGPMYHHRPDKALAFFWKAVSELSSQGAIGMVMPAPFLEATYSLAVREAISGDENIAIDVLGVFRGFDYFRHATVEPAFVALNKSNAPDTTCAIAVADDSSADNVMRGVRKLLFGQQHTTSERVFRVAEASLSASSWTPRERSSFDLSTRLAELETVQVDQCFDQKLGIRTGNNSVFMKTGAELDVLRIPPSERTVFRRVAGQGTINNGAIISNSFVFYPYRANGTLLIDTESGLKNLVPTFYEHVLRPNKDALTSRKSLRTRKWWELSEPRPTWLAATTPKIVTTYFAARGGVAFDVAGDFAVVQGFAWLFRSLVSNEQQQLAYFACMNSSVFFAALRTSCPTVSGGQFDLSERFSSKVRLPNLVTCESRIVDKLCDFGTAILERRKWSLLELDVITADAYGLSPDHFGVEVSESEEERFDRLATKWKLETGHLSSMARKSRHESYRQIIEMGEIAIPMILADLKKQPTRWFHALHALTGSDPIPQSSRGITTEMTAAWLKWGKEHGYDA